ncbi:hypothetical protein LOAG_10179 [Loa loa]|uniref:BTB domain-containing protein n=1 Tax=Loa loa TaxID=7209 RepID=A0A1S0TQ82_LOALO|nr:hypothetical protein LOAG_10179 [Loa loa]EFO18316.1 hypothetical protein LOAG_10179 [Loa loa]
MARNLLLRFNDGGMLVVHSQILAYYSARFFDNYRLNRQYVTIKSDARIARNLIQFHYTGILQLPFSHIEKYFQVASKLAFDTALEVLSQLLEKFSHRNEYHAIICANIACEPNNHVVASCVKTIINYAATFLKQPTNLYKTYASPNAIYRILQILAVFTDWKKSLHLALEWIVYEEWRHLYANSILDAIVFETSDKLIEVEFVVVKEEISRLPRKVGEALAERCNHAMYRYLLHDENNTERTNPRRCSIFSTDHNILSMRSFPYSKLETSSVTLGNVRSSTRSSETENSLLPACSSTKIFDEFLLDDGTHRIYTPNNSMKSLIPVTYTTNLMSHEGVTKQQQASSLQPLIDLHFLATYQKNSRKKP